MNLRTRVNSGDIVIENGQVIYPLVESSYTNHLLGKNLCVVQESELNRTLQFKDLLNLGINMIFVKKSRIYKTLLRQKFLLNKMVPPLLVVMVAPLGSLTIMLGMLTNYLKRTCLWHSWSIAPVSNIQV